MRYLRGLLLIGAIGLGAIGCLALVPNKTGLEFCNRSPHGKALVALATPDGKRWRTEGWLELNPGECRTAIDGALSDRFYYYYAETEQDYRWKGDQPFCISSLKFTFANAQQQCQGANSRWEKFRELDTGKDAVQYTLNLQ